MDPQKLNLFISEIRDRLDHAERKHPVFCKDIAADEIPLDEFQKLLSIVQNRNDREERRHRQTGENIVKEEFFEMLVAARQGNIEQAYNEAIDFMTTGFRLMEAIFDQCVQKGIFGGKN